MPVVKTVVEKNVVEVSGVPHKEDKEDDLHVTDTDTGGGVENTVAQEINSQLVTDGNNDIIGSDEMSNDSNDKTKHTEDESLISALVGDFNKASPTGGSVGTPSGNPSLVDDVLNEDIPREEEDDVGGEDSMIVSLVEDFNTKAVLELKEGRDQKQKVNEAEEEKNENLGDSPWYRGRSSSASGSLSGSDYDFDAEMDSNADLQELLGLVDDDNDDEDDDLTDAIQGFFIEHHYDKVEEKNGLQSKQVQSPSKVSQMVNRIENQVANGEIIESQLSADEEDDADEEDEENPDQFEDISSASVSVGLSVANSYLHTNPFNDDSSTFSESTTGTSGPHIMRASPSSRFSVDSVMGDIILDHNNIEEDSDIVPQDRRFQNHTEDESTVLLQDDSTAPLPEEEEDDSEALQKESSQGPTQMIPKRSPAKFKDDSEQIDEAQQQTQSLSQIQAQQMGSDTQHLGSSSLFDTTRLLPALDVPLVPSPRGDAGSALARSSSASHFQFLDLSTSSISTDAMRSSLLALQVTYDSYVPHVLMSRVFSTGLLLVFVYL